MSKEMNLFGDDKNNLKDIKPVFGIDLGTTNSAISVVKEGNRPENIAVDGKMTMPSCVMWKDGEFIVGEEAYEHRELSNVIYSVKRFMQTPDKEVEFAQSSSKRLKMTPAEVSAEILKGLVKKVNGVYGDIKDVVVTVPAYFNDIGRSNTRKACELAGLNMIDMINEPTAASLCYDVDVVDTEDILIFDLGGGTFDVTLARIVAGDSGNDDDDIYGFGNSSEKIITCLDTGGDGHLGGDDIDLALYDIVCEKIKKNGLDPKKLTLESREKIILALERYKKASVYDYYDVDIDAKLISGQSVSVKAFIGPNDFKAALLPTYKKCKKWVDTLLNRTSNKVSKMLLVGGSTKHPMLYDLLKEDYPEIEVSKGISQDLAVSSGAAIKGKLTKFGSADMKVFDILPITIGINSSGRMTPIIERGSTLPCTGRAPFTTVYDNQEQMRVEILQGESKNADKCVSLGELLFDDIPKATAGDPNLVVTLLVDANSMLKCSGSVNGISKEMLLDLTGSKAKSRVYDREAKMIERWRAAGEKMSVANASILEDMIADYPNTSKHAIMDFIHDNIKVVKEKDKKTHDVSLTGE